MHATPYSRGRIASPTFSFDDILYLGCPVIPAVGLLLAIRGKDRPLLTVSLVLAFATLATNKSYLGLRRESWDPILFGALLVVTATAARRWVAHGVVGQRAGFTAEKILERDRDWRRTVATASVGWPHDLGAARPPESAPSQFEGGRSGGGAGALITKGARGLGG